MILAVLCPAHRLRGAVHAGSRAGHRRCSAHDGLRVLKLAATEHILREPLKSLEARLDPAAFARIHRGVIVQIDRIRHLEPIAHGDYLVTMRDGRTLYAIRSFSQWLRHLLR